MDPQIAETTRHKGPNSCDEMDRKQRTVPWDEETSARLYAACRTQDACWNLALDWLVEHPTDPLRKSKRLGVKGLYGRWLEWREKHPWAKAVPQAIWRGGVLRAKEQVERWEAVNESHARTLLKAHENGKEPPGRVQCRYSNPNKLYRRRKDRDRRRRNTCLVTEGVKRIDEHTVHIPGAGKVRVRESLTAVGSFTGTFCGTPHDNPRPDKCTFPGHVLPPDTPETEPAAGVRRTE